MGQTAAVASIGHGDWWKLMVDGAVDCFCCGVISRLYEMDGDGVMVEMRLIHALWGDISLEVVMDRLMFQSAMGGWTLVVADYYAVGCCMW